MNWRVLLLGVAAFALAMLVVLPARWVGGLLPATVKCTTWRGTVWRGACRQLTVTAPGESPFTIASARWTLHPLPLLHARLAADVALTDALGDATGRVEFTRAGLLVLHEVSARVLLDPRLPTPMPAGWRARLEVQQLDLQWQSKQLRQLQGQFSFLDLRDAQGRELGNYRVSFPAAAAGPFQGQLIDEGGPLELQAQLTLASTRSWTLSGTVRARAGSDPALTRYLQALGAADPSGRYPLSASGTFN